MRSVKALGLGLLFSLAMCGAALAAAPTAVISASPDNGMAPLPVFFDGSLSSADTVSYLWQFGDGGASTAKSLTHIYNIAGTYVAELTVTNATGEQNTARLTITVTGNGEGPVTPQMNFRWALTSARVALNHATLNKDSLTLYSAFNTVDLPAIVKGVAVSFTVNNLYTINGLMDADGTFSSPTNIKKPSFIFQLSNKTQTLRLQLTSANLAAALNASGAGNVNASKAPVPITFTLTIGAQTYTLTEGFQYSSTVGGKGVAQFNLLKKLGAIQDGFFLISYATALQNQDGTGHFYEFDGYVSKPLNALLQLPASNGFAFTLNDANKEVVLWDGLRRKGDLITYKQPERANGGISELTINTVTRRLIIKTWDLPANVLNGGTGMPLSGDPYTAFDFVIRIDFDQPDGSVFQGVTTTRLSRKSSSDTLWQTGRKNTSY